MTDQLKDLFQTLIAPQLEAIKGEIHAVEAKTAAADPRLAGHYRDLADKVDHLHREFMTLSADIARLDQKLDLITASLADQPDFFALHVLSPHVPNTLSGPSATQVHGGAAASELA